MSKEIDEWIDRQTDVLNLVADLVLAKEDSEFADEWCGGVEKIITELCVAYKNYETARDKAV